MNVFGTCYDNIFAGTENDDFIFGFAGNDTLISAVGTDSLFGGRGDDIFIVTPQFAGETCYINGGRGDDLLYLAHEPYDVEVVNGHKVIAYFGEMTIIVKNVENFEYG
jgi:Ca2+-binding RTX toxin-like protein